MTEEERKRCQVSSAALISFSKMCLLVFITMPSIFILLQYSIINALVITLVMIFVGTSLFIAFRSWHLYFDGMLLKCIAYGTAGIGEVDLLLLSVLKKDVQEKSLNDRIDSCYHLVRGLFIAIGVHLVFFIGIILFVLI